MLDYLFSKYRIFDVIEAQKKALGEEIDRINSNQLLNTSTSDLGEYLYEKFKMKIPLLQKENIEVSQNETKIDVSHDPMRGIFDRERPFYVTGTEIKIEIPFEGDSNLFKVQPSTFSVSNPMAEIIDNKLVLKHIGTNFEPTHLKSEIDRQINEIEKWLYDLQKDTEGFNNILKGLATSKIEARKNKILSNNNLVASLGFKLKENPNFPQTYKAPEIKRKLSPTFPKASNQSYKPEPCLSNDDYEHILDVIDNMAHVMERSPSAFIGMDEESLRTHFLVQLNGQYEGQATGETFNFNGKTDILIRSNDKNIFIAECKFWKGEEKYLETIDQILSYTSWRDTKVAIIIFNKNKDLSNVIETVRKTTIKHENYKRELTVKNQNETELRYVFSHRDDKNREIFLTIKIYDIPQ